MDQLSAGELKKTACILAGAQYAVGSGVSFGLEYAHFDSRYFQSEKAATNQVMFSAILNL
jgi:opacity protein-like surface antigen